MMSRRQGILGAITTLSAAAVAATGWRWRRSGPQMPAPLALADYRAAQPPLDPPQRPLRVYHLGHSLVGRDMPALVAALAGHDHAVQLGWGASLKQHWDGDAAVPGFAEENAHPHFRPVREALESATQDVLVLTEMVELRDAIRWHHSAHYLAQWALFARRARPDLRIYLYETWHQVTDPAGWLERIDADLPELWERQVLRPAMAVPGVGAVHLVPGGQAMAAVARAAEAGSVPGVTSRYELFARDASGGLDPIHMSSLGALVVALTHVAVLYHRLPEAPPPQIDIAPDSFAALREIVWATVRRLPQTGISA